MNHEGKVSDRYIIGIDLGTTNSAVSFIDLSLAAHKRTPPIECFMIPQFTGPGEIADLKVLPSFVYLPAGHELEDKGLEGAWTFDGKGFAGAFARDQGVKVPGRLISSAKSWLCHDKVDRRASILPWGAEDATPKLSPVAVTAVYLKHIREAWNRSSKGDEEACLESQNVVITVPASFDEVARDLTVEAASLAGLNQITLLEEPLAAFYSWLSRHEGEWAEHVQPGELILVCDVGGGTTDFTLITLRQRNGQPVFERIAVGDHLILGGDNMDLALAHRCEAYLQGEIRGRLRLSRWQALCNQCRMAKERILNDLSESETITLVGEGRRLIAGTVSTRLAGEDVRSIVLDGFFPIIQQGESLCESPRQGMIEFGLPYAQDPAITRHLIRFLEHQEECVRLMLGKETPMPDLILFNGAALKPPRIQQRIREAVSTWFNRDEASGPRILENPDLDLAVALGASYYGLVRKGLGVRVDSGSPRAYYLGVDTGPDTERGSGLASGPERAICLVERHMPEGTGNALTHRNFHVLVNQPVQFYLYSSSYRTGDRVGDVVAVDETLTPLPPLSTVIKFGKKAGETVVPVEVNADYTEMGTLAVWCRSIQSPHRWRLQFQLRQKDAAPVAQDRAVFEEAVVEEVLKAVRNAFPAKGGRQEAARLPKTIVGILDRPRDSWPLGLIRRIADELLALSSRRGRTLEHEIRWLNLVGFCMRPGFGDALDRHRMESLWKLFHGGLSHDKHAQARAEWWVVWRRVAGGLSAGQQIKVLQEISPILRPGKKRIKKKTAPQENMEIWMTVANLERIPANERAAWGDLLLESLRPGKTRPQHWWALSRIGAREPLYGPIDRVVAPQVIESWIEKILGVAWPDSMPVGVCLAQLARLTGDRRRDLDSDLVQKVVAWLSPHEWAEPYIRSLKEIVPMDRQEETLIFGESLPSGIQLRIK
ncbi:MAG: hsp70 family protein [Deltaproteobacteria bacterium]|nr:hsp70 family protein [Deltaproteobacteria bacterium]